jgi:hypothetical protein
VAGQDEQVLGRLEQTLAAAGALSLELLRTLRIVVAGQRSRDE